MQPDRRLLLFPPKLYFYCDGPRRHLVYVPFSVENLHHMAAVLGIKRCWFHASKRHPHYDIPKRRIAEVMSKCRVVDTETILAITQNRVV